jgi:hypothetical protein
VGKSIARSAASVPVSTLEPSSTSRTHSDNVSPARSARDSSTRSSASDTFVPTDLDRSSRFFFIAHLGPLGVDPTHDHRSSRAEMHEGRTTSVRPMLRSTAGS